MEEVLARGGLPALPAVDSAAGWNLIAELLRLGKRDILQGPIWQAIHNPGYNRPPDYPDDPVNSEGAPLTQSYYLALADEEWEGDAWQGRSLAEVNRLRRRVHAASQPPGAEGTVPAARGGLFDVAALHDRHRELLGRAIPILSTNGGYVIGALDDARYPAVTPALHLAYTLEACRVMMGSSTRSAPAPDYFFCTTFWLLANQALESSRPARENDAWYSPEHPNGVLAIVPVLQAEIKHLRHAPQVSNAEPPAPSAQSRKNLIVFSAVAPQGKGIIAGKVRGGASVDLCLVHLDSGLLLQTVARSNGDYRFVDLPAGRYTVWVADPPGSRHSAIVFADDQVDSVDLAVEGWGYEITEEAGGPGGMLQCSIELTLDMAAAPSLRLRREGVERVLAMVRSGRDNMARCSAGPLEAGDYTVELLGVPDASPGDLRATAPIERTTETHIHFVHTRLAEHNLSPQSSVIEGSVTNGDAVQVTLYNAAGQRRSVTTDPRGGFRFAGLPAGSYTVTVAGAQQTLSRTRLGVDGEHSLSVAFELSDVVAPVRSRRSALRGCAPGQAGRMAIVTNVAGVWRTRPIDEESTFHFDDLAPGQYDLVAGDLHAAALQLGENECLRVEFSPLSTQWQVQVRSRPAVRRPGLVRVQVLGRTGVSVTLQGDGMESETQPTGSALDYGPFAVEFGPLTPGDYTVEVYGVDVSAAFTLGRADAVVVTFQRGGSVVSPPRLTSQPLSASTASA